MLKATLILGAALAWTAAAHADPIDCNQFWRAAANERPLTCELHTRDGFPRTLNGADIRIYRYADGWNDERGQLALLTAVAQAAEEAVPQFGRFAAVPNMYFVLHNEISDRSFAEADWQLPGSGEPCRIRLYFNIPNDINLARQIVAHEIFHCVQRHGIVAVTTEESAGGILSSRWWVEGSAEFASSQVFPTGNSESHFTGAYKPGLPLYRQSTTYATAAFFYATGLPLHGVIDLLKAQPGNSTFAGERQALAAGMAGDHFHQFALKLADKKIKGGGGKAIPLPDVPPGPALDVDPEAPQVGLSVIPFTINRSHLRFPAGTLVDLIAPDSLADDKLQISIRKVGDATWTKLSPGAPFPVDVACAQEDGAIYDLVYTTSKDQDEAVNFSLQVKTQGAEPRACPCRGASRPIDACLAGHWRLDNESQKEWLRQNFPGLQRVRVDVTGTYDFTFTRPRTARATQTRFQTVIFIPTPGGDRPWIDTQGNGTVDYKVVKTRPGKMCFIQTASSGTIRETVGGTGEEAPMGSLMGEAGDDAELSYECAGRTMSLWYEKDGRRVINWRFVKQ